jgi:hypothetical protein
MPSKQESFFQASLIVDLVAFDLEESVELGIPMCEVETVEICDRLKTASQLIREANGGVD